MAMWSRTPRTPMAMEVAAITAGPVRNLTAIENVATDLPQAMIFGSKAMKRPVTLELKLSKHSTKWSCRLAPNSSL